MKMEVSCDLGGIACICWKLRHTDVVGRFHYLKECNGSFNFRVDLKRNVMFGLCVKS